MSQRVLDQHALVDNLLRTGHLTVEAVMSGLRIIDASRRHRDWIVRTDTGPSFVAKQAFGPDEQVTLGREAAVYTRLSETASAVAGALPRLIAYDPGRRLLVLELVEGGSIAETLDGHGPPTVVPAAALGHVLARLHETGLDLLEPDQLPSAPPWVLDIHRPNLAWFQTSSEAGLLLRTEIQQRPDLAGALEELRTEWTPRALIHADLKLQHVIVRQHAEEEMLIAIVDWEMTQAGDPAWDAGTVLAGYLGLWLRSIPLAAGQPAGNLIDQSSIPLERLQQAIGAFWRSYAASAGLNPRQQRDMLFLAAHYAAASLIQDMTGRLQEMNVSPNRIALILDVSESLLLNPGEALDALAGIEFDRAAG